MADVAVWCVAVICYYMPLYRGGSCAGTDMVAFHGPAAITPFPSDWNSPSNWEPQTVPTYYANFGYSSNPQITFSNRSSTVSGILF
jgi:hypothetical protein